MPRYRSALRAVCYGEQPWPLFVHGPPRSGKTAGALSIADRCWRAAIYGVDELIDLVMDSGENLRETVEYPELLIVDDIGLGTDPSDLEVKTLLNALEYRGCKPAIYTSNHGHKALAQTYGVRIGWRLGAGSVLELKEQFK